MSSRPRRTLRAEFTVFPFLQAQAQAQALPDHVQAAVAAARETGVGVEVGPLSNVIEDDLDAVLRAVTAAEAAAFEAGATRFALNLEVLE